MNQITQSEFVDLIKEKQAKANIAYEQSQKDFPCYATKEKEVKNKAYIDCYQNLINDLNDIEIIPEHNDTQRNDRFREFKYDDGLKIIIDAKSVESILLGKSPTGKYYVHINDISMGRDDSYSKCKGFYNDLVEWWKYWKQN